MKKILDKDNLILFKQFILSAIIILIMMLVIGGIGIFLFLNDLPILAVLLFILSFIPVYYITILFVQKGIKKLNEKYLFTKYEIKKRQILFGYVIISFISALMALIPLVGAIIATYLAPIFYDAFITTNIRTGKVDLNLSQFENSFKKHKMFSLKYLVLGIGIFAIYLLCIIGIIPLLFIGNGISGIVLMIIMFILSVFITLYYEAIKITHVFKNLSQLN